ncbi:MAG TPA: hypothetical protein VHN20_06055 [Beijerinckiaceae bacterium]|nr:hypothetical protein [Beijerinckiaceae bacterium]
MPLIRVEAVQDPHSGNYYVQIFHPADADEPLVTTAPRYRSAAAAETDTIAILAAAANSAQGDNASPQGKDSGARKSDVPGTRK